MCAWKTSAAVCAEGFCKKVKSQLSAWMTSAAECAEGVGRKVLQPSAHLRIAEKICS